MAEIFNLELKDIEKRLKKEESERQEAQKKAAEDAKTMFCPKCDACMFEMGSLSIRNMQGDDEKLNGDYCTKCYSRWFASVLPKYEMRNLPKG